MKDIKYKNAFDETKQNMHSIDLTISRFMQDTNRLPRYFEEPYGVFFEGYLNRCPRNEWSWRKNKYSAYIQFSQSIPWPDIAYLNLDEHTRYNDEETMTNMCTGYIVGHDVIDWDDAFPWRWGEPLDRRYTRQVLCGNFLYIPLNGDWQPLSYMTEPDAVIAGYFLAAYGNPLEDGLDVWTPTEDPVYPFVLQPDGTKDGIIGWMAKVGDKARGEYMKRR